MVTLETFTNDVNTYLTDPNELPALTAMVGDLNLFVRRDNREAVRNWLIVQFPVLHPTAPAGQAAGRGFGQNAGTTRRFADLSVQGGPRNQDGGSGGSR